MSLEAAIVTIWLLCAVGTAWLLGTDTLSERDWRGYAKGLVVGLLSGPVGLFIAFITWEPRP